MLSLGFVGAQRKTTMSSLLHQIASLMPQMTRFSRRFKRKCLGFGGGFEGKTRQVTWPTKATLGTDDEVA